MLVAKMMYVSSVMKKKKRRYECIALWYVFLHQWLSVKLRLSINMYACLHKHLHNQ